MANVQEMRMTFQLDLDFEFGFVDGFSASAHVAHGERYQISCDTDSNEKMPVFVLYFGATVWPAKQGMVRLQLDGSVYSVLDT